MVGLMKPLIKLVADEVLSPLLNKVVKPAGTKVAEGLWKASNTKIGEPIGTAISSAAPNLLTGFYGTPLERASALVVGAGKTMAGVVYEQANPVVRKLRKDQGISAIDQQVAKKTIKFLDSDKAKETSALLNQRKTLSSNITRAKNKGETEKVESLKQQLKILREPTKAEKDKIKDAGKELQGQFSFAFMRNEMQGNPSPILREKFMEENYLGMGDFTKENFSNLSKERYWETENIPEMDKIMNTAYDRIRDAWGSDVRGNAQMYIKKTYASIASGNIGNEIGQSSLYNNVIRKIITDRKKPFKNVNEMRLILTRELNSGNKKYWIKPKGEELQPALIDFDIKDGALWYGDSYLSAAKELGGVNVQTALLPDATAIHYMSDVQDLLKMRMPAGEDGVSVTIPYIVNFLTPAKKSAEKTAYITAQKAASKERSGLFEAGVGDEIVGGMTPNQLALAREIAELKPDNLTAKEWAEYIAKLSVTGGVGYGVLNSLQER